MYKTIYFTWKFENSSFLTWLQVHTCSTLVSLLSIQMEIITLSPVISSRLIDAVSVSSFVMNREVIQLLGMSQQFFGKFRIYQEFNIDNKLLMKELKFETNLKLILTNPFLWRLSGIQQMRLRTRQLCHFLVCLRWFCTQVEPSSCLPVYPNIHGPVHHHRPFISNHHLVQY